MAGENAIGILPGAGRQLRQHTVMPDDSGGYRAPPQMQLRVMPMTTSVLLSDGGALPARFRPKNPITGIASCCARVADERDKVAPFPLTEMHE
jgi:hypothetical protein